MDEVSYECRETIEDIKGQTYKVTTVVRVQKKQVLTNPAIERRQHLKKFGEVSGFEKGQPDNIITLDDKDIYLLPYGQEKNEESIMKFISTRTHRDKLDSLKKKEDQLKSGKTEDSARRIQIIPDSTSHQVKVSNIPLWLTQEELDSFFAVGTRPRKVYRPLSKEDGKPRDFALLTYTSQSESLAAVKRFNGKICESQVLNAELAENKPGGGPFRGNRARK